MMVIVGQFAGVQHVDIGDFRRQKQRHAMKRWRRQQKEADEKKRAQLQAAAAQNAVASAGAKRPTQVIDPNEVKSPGARGTWATPKRPS